MLRRISSILMLFSALTILLGHDVIPHTHHSEHHDAIHHHDHHDDDNDDSESPFSTLQHGENGINFLVKSTLSHQFSKQVFSEVDLVKEDFSFETVFVPVEKEPPTYKTPFLDSLKFLPSGLRAPPYFIA